MKTSYYKKNKLGKLAYIISAAMLVASLLVNATPPDLAIAAAGSLWTTDATCTPQNLNHYAEGDTIYIRGSGFDPGQNLTWRNTSTNEATIYDSGTLTADGSGYFCVATHVVGVGESSPRKMVVLDGTDKLKSDN